MSVRLARLGDLDAIVTMLRLGDATKSMDEKCDERSVRISLHAHMVYPEAAILVALEDGSVVGMMALEVVRSWLNFNNREARAHRLYVPSEHRDKGVELALLTAAESWAQGQRAIQMIMMIDIGMKALGQETLCKAAGFIQTGICYGKEL